MLDADLERSLRLLLWQHAMTLEDLAREWRCSRSAMKRELMRLELLGQVTQMTSGEWVSTEPG